MSYTLEEIGALALREHDAEQNRDQAKAEWRAAWWDLTLALAAVEDHGRAVLDACEAAARQLDQSVSRMRQRRLLGRQMDHVTAGRHVIHLLPPELAREWMQAGRALDAEGIAKLRQYDMDGLSKRDVLRIIAEEDQTTIRRGMRTEQDYPDTAEQIRRAVERDPDIARHVADSPVMRRTVDNRRGEEATQRLHDAGLRPMPTGQSDDRQLRGWGEAISALEAARNSVRAAARSLADVALDDELREGITLRLDALDNASRTLRDGISGDMDAALATLLAEEGQS